MKMTNGWSLVSVWQAVRSAGATLQRRRGHHPQEPGAGLFRGIRARLTLWYCGVLGAALIIFGVALYFGTQYALLQPVQNSTQSHAQAHAHQWQVEGRPDNTCPMANTPGPTGPPMGDQGPGGPGSEIIVCFDPRGALFQGEDTAQLPVAFLQDTLAQEALHSSEGCASGTIDAGGSIGRIYRFAQVVTNPQGEIMGVVVAGEYLKAQDTALSTLMTLLLSIGCGALLCAGLGGLFLSKRALAPARLAWTNQQRFIADASHELRTPLTLMRADAEVLLRGRGRLDAEDTGLLEDIVTEANHMGKITANLLTLARLDNQSTHREHEVVNLTQLAGNIVRRVQALAGQRGITIREEYSGNPYVIGDPTLLEQAVLVLLDNAIKYNRQNGTIDVHATVHQERVTLEVRDSGIGITAEHLPYLGERFYRVDKARSRAAGGTGLGLSIARGIASAHGGQLILTSQPGQGVTAILSLPLAHEAHHHSLRRDL
jgi:signal transduction histidine kinase